ncbi:MAG: acyltransferase family protein [Clostridia bacterium]|nr:acyltransferase family protein [Clostridia bacterium]
MKREAFLDSSKAIGILLVILGHTYWIPNGLYALIYSFHMPLFFIISGYVYNDKKYGQYKFSRFAYGKFKAYIIPYLIFAAINLVLQIGYKFVFERTIIDGNYLITNLKGILLCTANKENMPNCSPIWFLVALFFATVVLWLILKYARKFALVIATSAFLISYAIYKIRGVNLPFKLSVLGTAVFFMYIGYVLRQYELLEKIIANKKRTVFVSIFIIAAGIAGYFNGGNVGLNENNYGYIGMFLIAAIGLSVAVLLLFKKCSFLNNELLSWFGKNTMYIMAFNYFMRDIAIEVYYMIPFVKNYTLHWIVLFLFTVVGCILAAVACGFVKNTFSKLLKTK